MLRGKKFKLREQKKHTPTDLSINIHNKFEIEVIDTTTGEVKQSAKGFNTICSNLWKYLSLDKTSYANCIHFGDGNGNPAPDDTSLFSFLGYKAVTTGGHDIDYEAGVFSQQYNIQLTEAEYVGKYITEVGIGYSSSSDTLCTHAMLQDMNGNPISIQKTNTDVINIYSTIYVHFNPYGYDNGHIFLFLGNSVGNSILGKLAGRSTSYYLTEQVRYYPKGGTYFPKEEHSSFANVDATLEVDTENKILVITANRLISTAGNNKGIGGMGLFCRYNSYGTVGDYNRGLYICPGGSIPSSKIYGESIGTGNGYNKNFVLKFPYARDAKIYINGVETTKFKLLYWSGSNLSGDIQQLMPHSTKDKHVFDCRPESNKVSEMLFYNPSYEVGLSAIWGNGVVISSMLASNDLINWNEISYEGSVNTIPESSVNYKYWKVFFSEPVYRYNINISAPSKDTPMGGSIVFDTAPAEGAIITADYTSDFIAKDENHVFDLQISINLGEYTISDGGTGGEVAKTYSLTLVYDGTVSELTEEFAHGKFEYSIDGGVIWNPLKYENVRIVLEDVKNILFRNTYDVYTAEYSLAIGSAKEMFAPNNIGNVAIIESGETEELTLNADTTWFLVGKKSCFDVSFNQVTITNYNNPVDSRYHFYSIDGGKTWNALTLGTKLTNVTRIMFKNTYPDSSNEYDLYANGTTITSGQTGLEKAITADTTISVGRWSGPVLGGK